jgi:hypothetical protein
MGMFTGIAGAWLVRRVFEVGGIFAFIASIVAALPPSSQDAIWRILQGDFENVSLAAVIGIISAVFGYVWSFRATVKEQVVSEGKKVPLKDMPAPTRTMIKEKTETAAAKRPTIFEQITAVFTKR